MSTVPWPIKFRLLVDHVYDGDTIMGTIYADAGLGMYMGMSGWSLRLFGINAPEMNATDPAVRTEATACRDYLRSLVQPGEYINFDSYSFDKYGRRVDGVPYAADGTDLCQAMLNFGNGVVVLT